MASTAATKPDQPVLVTGAAGFIGFHVARALLTQGRAVAGVDSLNSYYDPKLKESRLAWQFTLEVRNKFVDAYREVMRMSV